MSDKSKPSQGEEKDSSAPKGPETDPNIVGRPSSIIWIYLVFALVVVLAAGLGKAQSTALLERLRGLWQSVAGR